MDAEIDLTEKRYFRDVYVDPLSVKRTHPRKPWDNGDDEFVKLKTSLSLNKDSSYRYTLTNSTIGDFYELSFLQNEYSYAKISSSLYSWNNDYYMNKLLCKRGSSKKWEIYFPTGHVDDIRELRVSDDIKLSIAIKRKNELNDTVCYSCGKKISKGQRLFDNAGDVIISSNNYCPECEKLRNHKSLMDKNDRWNFNRHKLGYHERITSLFTEATVPCLSSDIPQVKKYERSFNEIKEYYDLYEEPKLNSYIHKSNTILNDSHVAYYKGKKLGRMEEMYQPKGRVPQDYDTMFDSMNWRDMLKYRLGQLESLVPVTLNKSELTLNTITYISNNINWFTPMNNEIDLYNSSNIEYTISRLWNTYEFM